MFIRFFSKIFPILIICSFRISGFQTREQALNEDNQNSNSIQTSTKEQFLKSSTRLAIKDKRKLWPRGNIPYIISDDFSTEDRDLIEKAISKFQNTCIRFEKKTPQHNDYIYIKGGQGCNSPVGRQGTAQNVTLGQGCLYLSTIQHELMHAIGFEHEHNRPDRDDYIIIHVENIRKVTSPHIVVYRAGAVINQTWTHKRVNYMICHLENYKHIYFITNKGMEYAFRKRTWNETTDLGFTYDYESVMQYERTAFSKNGRPTMEAKLTGVKLGSSSGLSQMDVQKINKLYGCEVSDSKINAQNVQTSNGNNSCPNLAWKKFQATDLQQLMVIGGNDSFGNKFYICRKVMVNNCMIAGQMFRSICYVVVDGKELAFKEFEVLTHSTDSDYKWDFVLSKNNKLPSNAVMVGESKEINFIGRCYLRYLNYTSTVIGMFRSSIGSVGSISSIGELRAPFNGKQITCNQFEILLC